MLRRIVSYGLFALVILMIPLAVWGVSGMAFAARDDPLPAPQAVGAQITTTWSDAVHPVVQVTFDQAMNTQSVADALAIEPAVPLAFRWEGRTLYLEPQTPLAPDTHYRFTLDRAATDVDRVPLGRSYHWGYVTGTPVAGVIQPIRNGDRSTPLVIQFANPMETDSVDRALVIDPPIEGARYWGEGGTLLLVVPARPLPNAADYTIHFDGELLDAAGNAFSPIAPLRFTTPPGILSASPWGETRYTDAAIEILFDRPMDTQVTEAAVRIVPELPGSFAWQGTRLLFEPDYGWQAPAEYTVTVSTDARDQGGTLILQEPYTWSFHVTQAAETLTADAPSKTACETSLSFGGDITMRLLLPQRLVAGDRVQVLAVVQNQSPCLRRVYASLDSDLLTVGEVTPHILLLASGEQRVVSWMATADRAGGGQVTTRAVSGMDSDTANSHVTVLPQSLDPGAALVGNVQIHREYLDVETGRVGDVVPIGQLVQVRLQLEMPYAGTDVIVSDHLPAGLEALQPQLIAMDSPDQVYALEDDGVRFHIRGLDAGRHVLTYLALATYAGEYSVPPAKVTAEGGTVLWGHSAGGTLTIDAGGRRGLSKLLGGGGGGDYYDGLSSCVGGTDNPNDAPYDAMFFEEYGVNPFVDTDEDNLSTFAVDVDTGSYTIMRYYVNDGYLPPDESVRVEEYVNYFDQGYEPPAEGEGAFAIHLEGAPSFFGGERHHLVRVGLQGYLPTLEGRPDTVLTFVIDVSGSMDRQDRLELVKDALALLVRELRPTDRIGIAVYGSRGYKLLEHTPVSEAATILAAIDRLQPEGSTNAEQGLRIGYRMAAEAFDPQAINRVILCSDGVANVGNTGADTILEQIDDYAERGIYLTTVGFGMGNYNDVLMEQLADHGDGFYAYVDTITEAKRLFVYELPSTLQVIARDARIQVEFNPAIVRSYRLIGYENRDIADEDFRNDSVDAGELGVGHSVTALYEVKFWEGGDAVTGPAMIVYVRYEDPETAETVELNRSIQWSEFAATFEGASARFQLSAVVAEYAEVLRQSYWARDSNLYGVLEQARRVAAYLGDDDDVVEFLQLVERASALQDRD